MRPLNKILYIILFSIVTGTNLFAQTYYVKADGNDSFDGLKDETAWRTISKVNSFKFNTGDDVYFKCGGTWAQQKLSIDWSGTSENKVIIGAYYGSGTIGVSGTKPIIDGNNSYPGLNGALVSANDQNYIDIKNLRVINSTGNGIYISGRNSGASHINITDCYVSTIYQKGIGFERNTTNSTIENCEVTDSSRVALVSSPWPSAIGPAVDCSNTTIRGNKVYGNHGEGCNISKKSNNTLVENNFFYDNRRISIYVDRSKDVVIRYNLIYGKPTSTISAGIGFDDEYTGTYSETANIEIYGNFIANCSLGFYFATGHTDSVFKGHKIYNNTVVDCKVNLVCYNGPFENSEIKNNIFWCISGDCVQASFPSHGGKVDFDYNLWSSEPDADVKGPNDISYSSPMLERETGWRTLEGKNVVVSDFALKKGSPAIDKGTQLSISYNELINVYQKTLASTTIYKLKQDKNGLGWEVGAAIFVDDGGTQPSAQPVPPSNLKIN